MKPRDYCCCAIPTVNAGIYFALATHIGVAAAVGILAVTTSSIVGASTPSFAPWVVAAVCFAAAAVQIIGFLGVTREKPVVYRRYVTLHSMLTSAAFSIALAWIVLSAVRHSEAKAKCLEDYFGGDANASEGDTLCTIFPWADIGIMGGLWVILAILHGYLYIIVSSYGTGQQKAHDDWDKQYDPTQPLTKDAIPLADRTGGWDSTEDNLAPLDNRYSRQYNHVRQNSSVSATDIMASKPQSPTKEYPNYEYSPYNDYVAQPDYAYTQPANPTPYDGSYAAQQGDNRPARAQAHPGEYR